jgi:hypothetical protein
MILFSYSLFTIDYSLFYSLLKLFTGLAIAAFIAWKLMVANAINNANAPAIKNIHQLIFILYAKFCNHLSMISHANGEAMNNAIATSFRKSFENKITMLATLAPSTLRTPISFVRCSALNVASPNKPRHEIRMATIVK